MTRLEKLQAIKATMLKFCAYAESLPLSAEDFSAVPFLNELIAEEVLPAHVHTACIHIAVDRNADVAAEGVSIRISANPEPPESYTVKEYLAVAFAEALINDLEKRINKKG